MTYAQMQNKAGAWVQPQAPAFAAAAAGAKWDAGKGFYLLLLDQPGAASWPITGATFILVHNKQSNPQNGHDVLAFFDWAYKNGNAAAESLDYVPLPESVKAMIRKSWANVKGPTGKPVYP
jgi:phosphate transport system substrate-binding protein